MSDILKAVIGAGSSFVTAWVFPAGVAVGAFILFLYPAEPELPVIKQIAALGGTAQAIAVALLPVALGLVMSALSNALFRILEGYLWPGPLQDIGVKLQRASKRRLVKQKMAAESAARVRPVQPTWRVSLYYEKLSRFPEDDAQIAPTALGNALRAFETYGASRYGLDSQTFWTELASVVPQPLQDALVQSRANVDFFVGLVYLTFVFALLALVPGLTNLGVKSGYRTQLLVSGIAAVGLARVWYLMAVWSCSYWNTTVRALVNLGRKPFAKAMSLNLPTSLEDEREMWQLLTGFLYYGYQPYYARLETFRTQHDDGDAAAASSD